MSKAMDDLRHEHDAILFTLKILGKLAEAPAGAFPREDARSLVGFLREFADTCHHGKEEGLLFPALEAAGVGREGGPIAVMLDEHDRGRAFVGAMASSAEAGDAAAFSQAAAGYTELLSAHIEKENGVLFPLAERTLSASTLERLWEGFERHEETVIGHGRHEELHRMLDAFESKYLG